jgi:cardiolipin synthase
MTLPNLLSLARMLLALPLTMALVQGEFGWALSCIVFAGITDLLDGQLARRFSWQSRIGGILDPAADKVLVFSAYCALVWSQIIPLWLFIIILLRDLQVIAGFLFLLKTKRLKGTIAPKFTGKLAVAAQIVLLVAIVAKLYFQASSPNSWSMQSWFVVCGGLTMISSIHYAIALSLTYNDF